MSNTTVTVSQFSQQLRNGDITLCVDVRNPDEFVTGHCRGSVNLPLPDLSSDALTAALEAQSVAEGETVHFICAAGKRAQMAADKVSGYSRNPICVVTDGGAPTVAADLLVTGQN